MRFSTLIYSMGQGIKNIWRNKMFSLASIATMSACIFLFGIFFSVVMNVNYMVQSAESDVAITVFFDEGLDQASIDKVGTDIKAKSNVVKDVVYVSADEAWEAFSKEYFEGHEEYAEGFRDNDNPLANAAHYEVYVYEIENQDVLVEYIKGLEGVRSVNQLEQATSTLSTMNRVIAYGSIIIILILLGVSVFLINNTVTMGVTIRKEEIAIMKLIGATNIFVRAPFLIEGMLIGLIGASIPLTMLYFLYNRVISYMMTEFSVLTSVMTFLSVQTLYRTLLPVGLALGIGIGLLGSLVTIRKHLRV